MTEKVQSRLIIFSAPSGAGKTSLTKALIDQNDQVEVTVSHTTRKPRPGEVDAKDYHFVRREQFQSMIKEDAFLEYAEVFDHFYGTSRLAVDRALSQGKYVLLEIDWQGARKIRNKVPDALSIFVLPPSKLALEKRLRSRGQDSDEVIQRRMRDALDDISHYREYDNIIVNDNFDLALKELTAIVSGQNYQPHMNREEIDYFVKQMVTT